MHPSDTNQANKNHEEDENGKMRSDLHVEDEHGEVEAQRVEYEHDELQPLPVHAAHLRPASITN
jgi:hypothetical protein